MNKVACRAALVSAALLLFAAGRAVVAYGGTMFSFSGRVAMGEFLFPASDPFATEEPTLAPEALGGSDVLDGSVPDEPSDDPGEVSAEIPNEDPGEAAAEDPDEVPSEEPDEVPDESPEESDAPEVSEEPSEPAPEESPEAEPEEVSESVPEPETASEGGDME